jgi:immune inhibitor A
MGSGNWLGWYGNTPAHMSSWCKIEMGWLEPTISTSTTIDVPIAQLATSPSAIKVWEDDYRSNRYFLVENRQSHGFDSDLNGTGLLIYHVNENRRAGFNSFGPINDDENDKMIDLEAADGEHDLDDNMNRGDAGDPFPGTSDNMNFNGSTNPSSDRNDGFHTGIAVVNISEPDSIMYADISPMLS